MSLVEQFLSLSFLTGFKYLPGLLLGDEIFVFHEIQLLYTCYWWSCPLPSQLSLPPSLFILEWPLEPHHKGYTVVTGPSDDQWHKCVIQGLWLGRLRPLGMMGWEFRTPHSFFCFLFLTPSRKRDAWAESLIAVTLGAVVTLARKRLVGPLLTHRLEVTLEVCKEPLPPSIIFKNLIN